MTENHLEGALEELNFPLDVEKEIPGLERAEQFGSPAFHRRAFIVPLAVAQVDLNIEITVAVGAQTAYRLTRYTSSMESPSRSCWTNRRWRRRGRRYH